MKTATVVTAFILLMVLALVAVYPMYACDGWYCAKDGTSFWNPFDYAAVVEYNNK